MWELAQVNVARLLAPLDSSQLQDFVDLLDPVNAAADRSPGFVWRLQSSDGNATSIPGFDWDVADAVGIIVNMSVWTDAETCASFVYGPMHRMVLRRRREWFQHMREAFAACWWVPIGHIPTVAEAEERVRYLREHGPSPYAFTLQRNFPPPDAAVLLVEPGKKDWLCEV